MNGTEFYRRMLFSLSGDNRITVFHIALVYAILYYVKEQQFENTITISRKTLMQFSHIGSCMTYHKCMRDLQLYGYLTYCPSYHPGKGSTVQFS